MNLRKLSDRLLQEQNECTLCWTMASGAPAATTVSFVWAEDSLWMTALANSSRVKAISCNSQVAVVVSGKGTDVGISRCLSLQGVCEIHTSDAIRDWFLPMFSAKVLPRNEESARRMATMMNSPENLVLQMTPAKWIPYDSHEAMVAAGGV